MTDDGLLPFSFPTISREKITAAFDGGRRTRDGGVMPLAMAERRLGIAQRLAALLSRPSRPDTHYSQSPPTSTARIATARNPSMSPKFLNRHSMADVVL